MILIAKIAYYFSIIKNCKTHCSCDFVNYFSGELTQKIYFIFKLLSKKSGKRPMYRCKWNQTALEIYCVCRIVLITFDAGWTDWSQQKNLRVKYTRRGPLRTVYSIRTIFTTTKDSSFISTTAYARYCWWLNSFMDGVIRKAYTYLRFIPKYLKYYYSEMAGLVF